MNGTERNEQTNKESKQLCARDDSGSMPRGNFGYEGGPYMGNLVQISAASGRTSGGGGGGKSGDYGPVISDGNGFIGFIDHEGRSASFQH